MDNFNKTKCEILEMGTGFDIKFADGTPFKKMDNVEYLGCRLNNKAVTPTNRI